ncbi:hypothetical protein PRJ39_13815 [Lysobacter enzymogenes]
MHQHAHGVDVAGRAVAAAGQQLRRGVVARERDLRRARALAGEGRGDAEVDQVHAAVVVDQQVGGLEVAVQHPARMRVGDRFAGLQQQAHAAGGVDVARVAPQVDGGALDQAHREPGLAVGLDAAVDQHRDAGMVERGEVAAFGQERLDQHRRAQFRAHALERHALLVMAVGAAGLVDRAHAAFGDHLDDAPGAELGADARVGGRLVRGHGRGRGRPIARPPAREGVQRRDVQRAGRLRRLGQGGQRRQQVRIAPGQVRAQAAAPGFGQIEVAVEQRQRAQPDLAHRRALRHRVGRPGGGRHRPAPLSRRRPRPRRARWTGTRARAPSRGARCGW